MRIAGLQLPFERRNAQLSPRDWDCEAANANCRVASAVAAPQLPIVAL